MATPRNGDANVGIAAARRRRRRVSPMEALLRLAATGLTESAEQPCSPVEYYDERDLQHALAAGQAPFMWRAVRSGRVAVPNGWDPVLRSADLCAKVRYGSLVDAANELIDVCGNLRVPVTLLKGLSVGDQFYPAPHERLMKDIDVLLPRDACGDVEAELLRRGYRRSEFEVDESAYHCAPLWHETRQVWVELHYALFPRGDALCHNGFFSASHLDAHSVPSVFHGRPVRRLTNEMQLVYLASYWMRDLTRNKIHPSFVPPLFDAVYLLEASERTFDWHAMLGALDNETASSSLYVLLAYLHRAGLGLCPASTVREVASRQRIVGMTDLSIVLALVNAYLVAPAGRRPLGEWGKTIVARTFSTMLTPGLRAKLLHVPWNVLFPPRAPNRYSLEFQRQRLARILGRRGAQRRE